MSSGSIQEWELDAPQPRYQMIVDLFSTLKGTSLLDVGCGNGASTRRIMEALGLQSAEGVDLLADTFHIAEGVNVKSLDLDKEHLPYPSESFDLIHCGEVLEHLYDPDYILDEMYRVLTPEGFCVVTTPNLACWPNRILLPLGYQPFHSSVSLRHEGIGKVRLARDSGHRGHIRVFTLKALKELLSVHNFRIVRLEGWGIGYFDDYFSANLLSKIVLWADNLLAKIPSLANRLVVVVQKGVEVA